MSHGHFLIELKGTGLLAFKITVRVANDERMSVITNEESSCVKIIPFITPNLAFSPIASTCPTIPLILPAIVDTTPVVKSMDSIARLTVSATKRVNPSDVITNADILL